MAVGLRGRRAGNRDGVSGGCPEDPHAEGEKGKVRGDEEAEGARAAPLSRTRKRYAKVSCGEVEAELVGGVLEPGGCVGGEAAADDDVEGGRGVDGD